MAKPTPKSIEQMSDKLHRRYEREYAGLPRHTRSVEPLEQLVGKASDLLRKAKRLKGEVARAVESKVEGRLKLYATERDKIAEARYEKPEIHEAHRWSLDAQKAIDAYRRSFGGRPRAFADTALLGRLLARVEAARDALGAIVGTAGSLDVTAAFEKVKTHVVLMRDEAGEIGKAIAELDEDGRRQRQLALAQQQLDAYRVHFAGHPRATTEPARLEGIVAALEEARAGLEGVEGVDPKAYEVIAKAAQTYAGELPRVREAWATTSTRDRAGQLGSSANHIFALYKEHFAGQQRSTRNLQLLGDMLERLASIHDQMTAIAADEPNAQNLRNLGVVETNLRSYGVEWGHVAEAKAKAAPAPGISVQQE